MLRMPGVPFTTFQRKIAVGNPAPIVSMRGRAATSTTVSCRYAWSWCWSLLRSLFFAVLRPSRLRTNCQREMARLPTVACCSDDPTLPVPAILVAEMRVLNNTLVRSIFPSPSLSELASESRSAGGYRRQSFGPTYCQYKTASSVSYTRWSRMHSSTTMKLMVVQNEPSC